MRKPLAAKLSPTKDETRIDDRVDLIFVSRMDLTVLAILAGAQA